ncbi:nucleoside deaminase [Bacteroides fragilis]
MTSECICATLPTASSNTKKVPNFIPTLSVCAGIGNRKPDGWQPYTRPTASTVRLFKKNKLISLPEETIYRSYCLYLQKTYNNINDRFFISHDQRRTNEESHRTFQRKCSKRRRPLRSCHCKDGEIVATGVNRVTASCDPTAHAEVSAIRAAASKLGTFNLSGYEIYTSCEPCPMCLGAIYWARLDKMYYGNNKTDAKNIGFDDSFIYDELELKPENRKLPSEVLLHDEAIKAFEEWMEKEDKIEY